MRGEDEASEALFSYVSCSARVPKDHPLRSIRRLVDGALQALSGDFAKLYAKLGRPSIPPEKLLRALLLQVFYSVRSERQLMEQLDYNLLFRWFVGLSMDAPIWDVTVFTKNRERLLEGDVAAKFFGAVLDQAEVKQLLSNDHFSVDGTLIEAWASMKSFRRKDGNDKPPGPGRNGERGFHKEKRSNETHESLTDPMARLYKKTRGAEARLGYLGHVVTENRNGLVVAAEASLAATIAEREAALRLLDRVVGPKDKRRPEQQITLGADTQYQEEKFIEALRQREVAPHVSEYVKGNLEKNSLTEAERGDQRRSISQRKRKLIERVFGWSKLDGPLRQVKLRGLDRVDWFYRMIIVAHNLVRMRRLIPIESLAH